MKEVPNALLWYFDHTTLKHKKYLPDLDFIKENTKVTHLMIRGEPGVNVSNPQQCHPAFKEVVEYAHKIGLKIMLHIPGQEGFLNTTFTNFTNLPEVDQAQLFPMPHSEETEAITCDYEMTLDENGYAEFTHTPKWSRPKIASTFNRILKIYAFEKTGEGFYKEDSLVDITDKARIVVCRTNAMEAEIYAGKENAGKTVFAIVAQYYNTLGSGKPQWQYVKKALDYYADIPFDGIGLDEWGMSALDKVGIVNKTLPPFRGRRYSKGMNEHFANDLKLDLPRLLFDMRYAPEGKDEVRIKAINIYFDELKKLPLYTELQTEPHAKKLFGEDIYMGVHNTFHQNLSEDEIWCTGCNWWDLPREYGHTDENICFPVRWGVMFAAKKPIMIDMDFNKDPNYHYNHMIVGAPLNCREFHHAYNDTFWGQSWTNADPEFLKTMYALDEQIKRLNPFQTQYPKTDLLVIYGTSAQANWYPDYEARNEWDFDGKMQVLEKCEDIWNAGYRCALIPDTTITDGRTKLVNGKVTFNGHTFSHVLFLYPKYAKKPVYAFLNDAHKAGVPMAIIGKGEMDFDAEKATLVAPTYEEFSMSVLENMGCQKSALKDGCIYADGSFSLVNRGLLTGDATEFSFTIDGVSYTGKHTGLLAYRKGEFAFASKGSSLFVNGKEVKLEEK